jgi:hypothetical protein
VSRGRETAGRLALAVIPLALLALLSACGGSTAADVAPYLGSWLRVEAGEPNPAFTLTVAGRDGGADVTFSNQGIGMSQTVAATAEDGGLSCVLPTADDPVPGATSPAPSGVPTESDLHLSLDENGRLVVDLVLADGTLEPIWIYERAAGSTTIEP